MTEIEELEIRTDVICHRYNGHLVDSIANEIAIFLVNVGKWKHTADLYKDFITRHPSFKSWVDRLPDKDKWINDNFVTGECCREMVKQLQSVIDDTDEPTDNVNHYYFLANKPPVVPQMGVILNQKIYVDKTQFPTVYRKLFAFMFSECIEPTAFLHYHYAKTFGLNLNEYKLFLFNVEGENASLLVAKKRLWDEWIDQVKPYQPTNESGSAKAFKALFKTEALHAYIIKELSQENPVKWFDENGNWDYQGKTNEHQSAACDLLFLLIDFDYLRDNVVEEVKKYKWKYAKDCFQVEVGKSSRTLSNRGNKYTALANRIKRNK